MSWLDCIVCVWSCCIVIATMVRNDMRLASKISKNAYVSPYHTRLDDPELHCSVKVGFHYPSSRAEFTGRVDGPRTRVHFLTPVNSGRELG